MDVSSRGLVLEVASLGLSQPWCNERVSDDDLWHLGVSDDCWEFPWCILNVDKLLCLHTGWPSSSLQSSSRVQHLRWLCSKMEFEGDTFSLSSLTSVNTESLLCDLENISQRFACFNPDRSLGSHFACLFVYYFFGFFHSIFTNPWSFLKASLVFYLLIVFLKQSDWTNIIFCFVCMYLSEPKICTLSC